MEENETNEVEMTDDQFEAYIHDVTAVGTSNCCGAKVVLGMCDKCGEPCDLITE